MFERQWWVIGCCALLAGCLGEVPESGDEVPESGDGPLGRAEEELNLATELMTLTPSVNACSASGYGITQNCYNSELPPAPSLLRSAVAPRPRAGNAGTASQQYSNDFSWSAMNQSWSVTPQVLPSDSAAVGFGGEVFDGPVATNGANGGSNEPGAMQVLPWGRSSIDGRLVLGPSTEWNALSLFVFSPENLRQDLLTNAADSNKRPFSRRNGIPLAALADPRTPATCVPNAYTSSCVYPAQLPAGQSWQSPAQVYWDLCTTAQDELAPRTGPNLDTGNARTCTSSNGVSSIDGDCYDVSLVMLVGYTWNDTGELTSTDLTVFVPRGKLAPTAASGGLSTQSFNDWTQGVRIYPRTGSSALPNYHDYESPWDPVTFVTQARTDCPGNTVPANRKWCEFFQKERHVRPQDMTVDGWTANNNSVNWASGVAGEQLIEPTTTADGRVVMMNGGAYGVVYAVNTSANASLACHVDQWTHLSPLSRAPGDSRLNTTYGFARNGLRSTQGTAITAGYPISGSYPWVDRKGDNVFFSAGGGRDAYKDESGDAAFDNKNGKANVVVGAWTRGKLIIPDGALNFTDFGYDGRLAGDYGYSYKRNFQLYQGAKTPVRHAGTVHMFSFENQLAHLDALTPVMPFDVVWTMSSNTEHNAELVFDEYLNKNALVVAHMNAPLTTASYVHSGNAGIPGLPVAGQPPVYDDGFTAVNPEGDVLGAPAARPQYRYAHSPRLQNASTILPGTGGLLNVAPAQLTLYGG
ncbi:MAG: hypothetical protein ABI193_09265, partial [Minicystis sp.]